MAVKIYNNRGKVVVEATNLFYDMNVSDFDYEIDISTDIVTVFKKDVIKSSHNRADIQDKDGNTFASNLLLSEYFSFFLASNSVNSTLLYNSLSSGILTGGEVTINVDNTKIDIQAGSGYLVDDWTDVENPIPYRVEWSTKTAVVVTNLLTSTTSHIGIDKDGNVVQYPQKETNEQRRDIIMLAQLGHANSTTVQSVNSNYSVIQSPIEQLRDLIDEFNLINNGNTIFPNGVNLNINKSAGTLFGDGINYINNIKDPHRVSISAQTVASFRYRTQLGGTTSAVTLIDPTKYDLAGVITTVGGGANSSTNQRVYLFPNGNLVIQYGQQVYNSLSEAIQGLESESFVRFINVEQEAILIGVISMVRTATQLNNTAQAKFIPIGKLGETIGGTAGISTSTLQQAYNNSVNPEILTDSTRGAVSFKRGSSSDTDDVTEILNGSGTKTHSVNGNGEIFSGSETASTIAHFDANKKIKSLSTATYPTLTELSYIKGVTSGIQTQIDGKQNTLTGSESVLLPDRLLFKQNTAISHTGSTGETVVATYLVSANQFQSNDILKWYLYYTMTNNANAKEVKCYFNTSPDLSGSPISLGVRNTVSTVGSPFGREIVFNNSVTSQRTWNTGGNLATPETSSTSSLTNLSIDFTVAQYFIVTVNLATGTDNVTIQWLWSKIMR